MPSKTLAVNNGMIIGFKGSFKPYKGSILSEGGKIKEISDTEFDADSVIDANSKLIFPGFINTHNHVAMSRFKGLLDDVKLSEFLERTFRLDAGRTDEDIYNSSVIGILEMIESGTTSFADLYYSEDVIARAVQDTGIRGFLSWNTLDKEFTTQSGDPLDNAENFIKSNKGKNSMIKPSIGVQGIYVASDATYESALGISRKHGTIIHTHLAETREEVNNCLKSRGKRPTEKLAEIGFLNENLLAAHTVWVNLSEIRSLGKNGVSISWNSVSNEKLGVGGIPPIPEMVEMGVNVSIGTDSNGSNNSLDMFSVVKNSAISMKNSRWDPSLISAAQALEMATVNGAKALHDDTIGSIDVGKKADFVVIDSDSANMIPTDFNNAVNNMVYSANPANVETVVIEGRILKANFRLSDNLQKLRKSALKYLLATFN